MQCDVTSHDKKQPANLLTKACNFLPATEGN